jgi:ethanolamine permease
MQGLSFIVLRKNMPNIVRPYCSPVGVPGAFVTVVIALVTLWYQFQIPEYRDAMKYVAAFYVLGIVYFAVYGRNRLILSPEEEFALSKGEKGHA